MNKYQNALNIYSCLESETTVGEYTPLEYAKSRKIIHELVEKTIPKKAILVHDYDGLVYECPICHEEFRPDTIMNHVKWKGCPYCLQNLDWSDEE